MVKNILAPFVSCPLSNGYSEWKEERKNIKEILHEIGSQRSQPFMEIQERLLTYVGIFLLEFHGKSSLIDMYEEKCADLKLYLRNRVYDLPVVRVAKETSGLPNYGAVTCYLNSIYQSFSLTELYSLLLPSHSVDVDNRNLQSQLYRLANAIRSGAPSDVIALKVQQVNGIIRMGKDQVDAKNPQQQDVSEYLEYLLNQLNSDDVNLLQYYGVVKQLTAPFSSTIHVEPLQILPLELNDSSIPGLLSKLKNGEFTYGDAGPTHQKWHGIGSSPKVILISLKRFSSDEYGRIEKKKTPVNLPVILDFQYRAVQHGASEEGEVYTKKYRLSGIYLHHGDSIESGHYTFLSPMERGFIEKNDIDTTYHFGDDIIQTVEENAYVVMYTEYLDK